MKTINVPFEDEEYSTLNDLKEKLSWHDFIIKLSEQNKEDNLI